MEPASYWKLPGTPTRYPSLESNLEVDAVIIGGGLTGITTAYLLKEAGAKVVLVERGYCAAGDTGRTTAHLTYVTDQRLHHLVKVFGEDAARAFWEAGAAAIDQIHDIARIRKIDCEFKWVPGYLHGGLFDSGSKDRKSLEADAGYARKLGFEAEFIEEVPYAKKPGVRFAHQAKFHPLKYVTSLLHAIPGNGSHVFEQTEASEVESNPLAVRAGRYKLRCQYIVIATHNPLAGKTGLVRATLFQTKLALYTSYVLGARVPVGTVPEALFWDTADPYYYLRTDRRADHDYIIFGGEDVKTGQEEDTRKVFARLESRLKQVLPAAVVQDRWLGQVVQTNDGLPFIGESAGEQFIATGFCGNGFTLGTLSAVMARDRYLNRKNPWFDLFAVGRKQFHGGTWRYLKENLDYPYYLLRDRFAAAESGSLDDIGAGEGKILRLGGKKVAAYRDYTGKVTLCSPVCTHLKCIVRWNAADGTWDCPCHGSRFQPTGEVAAGPAEAPLEKLPLTQAGKEKKYQERSGHKVA
jgi:glycine/D-amino acid oxidase-like deaminating enzyme/nitrite reductase/ring-hydroxylating ferredoxin subunit